MSKHGFGPMPEIPPGAPIAPFDDNYELSKTQELLARVLIKLWNDGMLSTADPRWSGSLIGII